MSGQVVKNHTLLKRQKIQGNTENYVPIAVPGSSTASSCSTASTSPTSLLHCSTAEDSTPSPATTRSDRTSSRFWRDKLHHSEQTGDSTQKKIDLMLGNLLHDLLEWLEDFTENLVEEGASASSDTPASTSRESDQEFSRKVVSGNHSIFTPKDEFSKCARGPKLQGLFAENALATQHFEQKIW